MGVDVISTFTDLKRERDALNRDAFQRLEKLFTSRGCQFQAIDLRKGVSLEASVGMKIDFNLHPIQSDRYHRRSRSS